MLPTTRPQHAHNAATAHSQEMASNAKVRNYTGMRFNRQFVNLSQELFWNHHISRPTTAPKQRTRPGSRVLLSGQQKSAPCGPLGPHAALESFHVLVKPTQPAGSCSTRLRKNQGKSSPLQSKWGALLVLLVSLAYFDIVFDVFILRIVFEVYLC